MSVALCSTVFTGCDEDLAVPPLAIPSTDVRANTKIIDFKQQYWSAERNYCTKVGKTASGDNMIIGGRVIANDEGGNIYQNLMIQDETGSICIAVATSSTAGLSDLNTKYKIGEEVFVNVTDLYAGKYAGLFQVGTAGDYNGTPQTSKMDAATFLAHTYLNGLPNPAKINVVEMTIPEILAAQSDDDQMKYQSQIVSIRNVSFIGGGTETWGAPGTSSTAVNRYLCDAEGNQLLVRNSNLSDFVDQILPAGHGDVKGILGYYNGTWQFMFQSPDDCTGFEGESYAPQIVGTGTADDPYQVSSVLAGVSGTDVWVTGYIVGWVEGQVLSSGAHFTTPASSASNILLAATPDETNVAKCIPVQLTSGTAVRTALNLQNNPDNLGKEVSIKGALQSYFGAAGLKTPTAYAWGAKGDDNPAPDPTPGSGDGTAEKPYACSQVIAGATGSNMWITGYIVGAVNGKALTDAAFSGTFTQNSNLLLADSPNETNTANCVAVQLPAGDIRSALNLVDNASNLGKQVSLKGNLEKYFGTAGLKSTSAYNWGATGSGGSDTPQTAGKYKKVTSITSGKQYLIVADGKAAKVNTADYGYLSVDAVTDNGGIIEAPADNAFTITAVSGGYTIKMSNGKYIYQKGTFNSFNYSTTEEEGSTFTITAQSDGTFKIVNVSTSKYIQYSSQYTSYGCYATETGVLPALYEKQ